MKHSRELNAASLLPANCLTEEKTEIEKMTPNLKPLYESGKCALCGRSISKKGFARFQHARPHMAEGSAYRATVVAGPDRKRYEYYVVEDLKMSPLLDDDRNSLCPHDLEWTECEACLIAGDLAFDAARERSWR